MSSNPPAERDRPCPWSPSRWSLRLRLLAGQLVVLVAVVAGIGITTELALRQFLVHQLDNQLLDLQNRSLGEMGGGPRLGPPPPRPSVPVAPTGSPVTEHPLFDPPLPPFVPRRSTGPGPSFLGRPGIPAGTVGALVQHGAVLAAARIGDDGAQAALSPAADARLAAIGPVGRGETLTLDGRRYRVIADSTWHGSEVVTGLPMAGVDAILMRGLLILLIVTAAALFVAITLGIWLIRRALVPLDRVVATAAQVADLRLDRGEVVLPVRVPVAGADPGTEVGKLGSAVNNMLDHVADALTARYDSEVRVRRFLADASHELRTPLSAIRGYTELAQRNRNRVPETVADAMSRVDAAARRMSALVEDMLLLARLDSGRPLEHSAVDLSQLTVDAISDAHIAGPRHHWDLDLPDDPVVIDGDAARLHQVLANLLANSRLHTPPGTRVSVLLDTDTAGDAVWRVSDNGPGIPGSLRGEIFERFARGDSSRSRHAGSTGLGLAIVAAVVKAHGGAIAVDSEPGRTEFTVRLPGVVMDADQ